MLAIVAIGLAACARPIVTTTVTNDTAFAAIVRSHLQRFPLMTTTDLYKLTHQAAFGAEHAISDSAVAAGWLQREWNEMGVAPRTQLFDTIAPGGTLVRLNLRAWRAAGGDHSAVLGAFLATGRATRRDTTTFERYWTTITRMAEMKRLGFDPGALQRLGDSMRVRGYPAMNHSSRYRSAYHPAYRVIDPALLHVAVPAAPRSM